jgi:hypothetical protein
MLAIAPNKMVAPDSVVIIGICAKSSPVSLRSIGIVDAVKEQIEITKISLPKGIYTDIRYDASASYSQRIDLLLRNRQNNQYLHNRQ